MHLRILLIGILLCSLVLVGQDKDQLVSLQDNSDWWSVGSQNFNTPHFKPSGKDLAAENFAIAGLALDFDDHDPLQAASRKFGNAITVERDATGSGREQICYVSSQNPNTHLIFEAGELDLVFYWFAGGQHWNGEDLCSKSSGVTEGLRTDSGLGLGITPADLQRILGKPDFSDGARFIYERQIKKTFSTAELAKIRKSHPEISESEFKEFEETHRSYALEIYIETRFANSHLTYLMVVRGRDA
jgi:hypothetical protein